MITESTKKYVKKILNEKKEKRITKDQAKQILKEVIIKQEYINEVENVLYNLKENLHTRKEKEIADYLEVLAYSNPFKDSLKEEKEGRGMRHPQLARSFGYMVSSGENATLLYNNLVKMYPLLNRKLLRMIALLMGKTNKILQGKSPNEIARGNEKEEPTPEPVQKKEPEIPKENPNESPSNTEEPKKKSKP